MQGTGTAVSLPADIDTDVIIAGRYLRTKDRSIWGTYIFEDLDPGIAPRLNGAFNFLMMWLSTNLPLEHNE